MAELSNPQLVEHSNGTLRPLGDRLTKLMILTDQALVDYAARDLGTIITNGGSTNLITDGSITDGRTRVAGDDVFNLITLLQALQTFYNVAGRRDVIAKWNVNGHRG